MSAVSLLLNGEYGAEPTSCPMTDLIPEGRKAYIVPRPQRALVTTIAQARRELNAYKESQPYVAHGRMIEERAAEVDELLRQRSGAPGSVVEYHAEWFYSVLTQDDIAREHAEFEEKLRAESA